MTASDDSPLEKAKNIPTSTVGRGKSVTRQQTIHNPNWSDDLTTISLGDSELLCQTWDAPDCIISDGAYGILGFEGDTSDHFGIAEWYQPHIQNWSSKSSPKTVLWFWNSEIGWATVHPLLEKLGWRYVNANIWDKGLAHIAGNVNTKKIRRFPVVTEVCVQYVFEAKLNGKALKKWLLDEWKRTGLPTREANVACGVADAAVRKYLDQGHLWYWMPQDMFQKMSEYANSKGRPEGRPYFSVDGKSVMTPEEWALTRSYFECPHAMTNVWQRNPLKGQERIKVGGDSGKAVHLNQKPLDLMSRIIQASTREGDVVWEPFGGLFSASVASRRLKRRSFGAEIDPTYYHYGYERLIQEANQGQLF